MQQPTPNLMLRRLDALVGEWEIQPDIELQAPARGWATFEWLEDKFLIQRTDAELGEDAPPEWVQNAPFPTTAIIGLDDATGDFTMLYADARAVFRVYQMSLTNGIWKVWRQAPGFDQRFTGTFSKDGATITGYWELCRDGSTWEHDFDLTYTKTR